MIASKLKFQIETVCDNIKNFEIEKKFVQKN